MQLKEGLIFAKSLTWKRCLNALKVLFSYLLSKVTKKASIWGQPVALAFEPTTSCNLRCPECPSGLRSFTRPTGMLQKNLYQETIEELSENLLYLTFYFQGEPYLHPEFLEMVQFATQKGIYTATSTNAHYLSPENAEKTVKSGLGRLIISIDGTSQSTYEQYRVGGSLKKVMAGTKNILAAKKKYNSPSPYVIFQFLVVAPNENQLEEVKELAQELGVDELRFKSAQVYSYENGNALIPKNEKYSRYYQKPDGKWEIKNRLLNHCWKMWHSCVITWDGKVIPCCFDKDASHTLGSIQKDSFHEIWKSKAYHEFRANLIGSRNQIDMCQNCTEGTLV